MVAFDNTVLSLLMFPDADLRQGCGGQKVEYARERVLGLVQKLEDAREQVAVPAPALSELLVTDGVDVQDVLTTLRGSPFIRIESFDERAAVELAMRLREARKAGDQRGGPSDHQKRHEVRPPDCRHRARQRCERLVLG
jgi:hypothetical protein